MSRELTIAELNKNLTKANETLILLLEISKTTVPKIKSDIKEITQGINDGFDTESLTNQAILSIDNAINNSTYSNLLDTIIEIQKDINEKMHNWNSEKEKILEEIGKSWFKNFFLMGLAIGIIGSVAFNTIIAKNPTDKYNAFINQLQNLPLCKMKK